jgi:hypothetical protein
MGMTFAPRYMGMKMSQFASDLDASSFVDLQAMNCIGGFDGLQIASPGAVIPSMLSGLWLSKVKVPGKELPDDSPWQVVEAEVMTPQDYDTILQRGWDAFVAEYMPRVVDMKVFGERMMWVFQNGGRMIEKYSEHGYVVLCDAPVNCCIPFEYFCGARSMSQFYRDLRRMPDKVEAAMKVVQQSTLEKIKAAPPCSPLQVGCTWIGSWRSAPAMISPKLLDRFVWPYVLELVDALVSKGYTPIFHFDQDWTLGLDRLTEVPPKTCVLNPDGMTDVRKFRKIVGDRMSLLGDVPSSLFAVGSPDDVYDYVRRLVQDTGSLGLLLCPGCDAPINTKPGNMEAFVAAARDYGR